jgi:hypothetical protein
LAIVARRTKASLDEICDEYSLMNKKLQERTVSIEELVAQKQHMAGVPKLVQNILKRLNALEVNYDILEEFFYNMSPDDFSQKMGRNWLGTSNHYADGRDNKVPGAGQKQVSKRACLK